MKKLPTLKFFEAIQLGWKNKFNVSGRARRSEFWWLTLIAFNIFFVLTILLILIVPDEFRMDMTDEEYVQMEMREIPYDLAFFFIPLGASLLTLLTVMIRRLHDVGWGGWIVVAACVLYWLCIMVAYAAYYYDPVTFYEMTSNQGIQKSDMFLFLEFSWVACFFMSFVIYAISIVVCLLDGTKTVNKYGPSPKYVEE